ncbi:MAG: hypothetical protein GY829_04415, partial [Gammaproteobacteria bacterium]|nr:hypothetical protein [Gammaproteobacteria bacterium]
MKDTIINKDLADKNNSDFFLPDFCHSSSVFMVVLVSELLAIILALVRFQGDIFWQHLGQNTFIIQWIALLSTALLCMSRPVLSRLSDLPAGIIGYFMVLIVTFFVSVG